MPRLLASLVLLWAVGASALTDARLQRLGRAPRPPTSRQPPALSARGRTRTPQGVATPELQAAVPSPRVNAWPCGDALDQRICTLAIPALLNFLVLPLTGAIDLGLIGQLGSALATAGQAAANQVYSTAALLSNVIPIVTVPLVAKAHAAGDEEAVQRQVGGAIFLSLVLGALVTLLVGLGASRWLLAVGSAAALPFSLPYLLGRLPGVIPDTVSTVGFSSLRGVMDTVTPLKVSVVSCVANAALSYLFMFPMKMGIAGAALGTAAAQIFAGLAYFAILLRRRLVRWATALRPPSREMLAKLAASGGAVQVRCVRLIVACPNPSPSPLPSPSPSPNLCRCAPWRSTWHSWLSQRRRRASTRRASPRRRTRSPLRSGS